jgi:hypothetical protein
VGVSYDREGELSYMAIKEEEATCENCVFYLKLQNEEESGLCRRHPPQVVCYSWDDMGTLRNATDHYQPLVQPGDWCGEWKPE